MKRNRYIIAYVLLAFCFIKHPVVRTEPLFYRYCHYTSRTLGTGG